MRKGSVEAHLEGECRYRIDKEELRALPLQVEVGPG